MSKEELNHPEQITSLKGEEPQKENKQIVIKRMTLEISRNLCELLVVMKEAELPHESEEIPSATPSQTEQKNPSEIITEDSSKDLQTQNQSTCQTFFATPVSENPGVIKKQIAELKHISKKAREKLFSLFQRYSMCVDATDIKTKLQLMQRLVGLQRTMKQIYPTYNFSSSEEVLSTCGKEFARKMNDLLLKREILKEFTALNQIANAAGEKLASLKNDSRYTSSAENVNKDLDEINEIEQALLGLERSSEQENELIEESQKREEEIITAPLSSKGISASDLKQLNPQDFFSIATTFYSAKVLFKNAEGMDVENFVKQYMDPENSEALPEEVLNLLIQNIKHDHDRELSLQRVKGFSLKHRIVGVLLPSAVATLTAVLMLKELLLFLSATAKTFFGLDFHALIGVLLVVPIACWIARKTVYMLQGTQSLKQIFHQKGKYISAQIREEIESVAFLNKEIKQANEKLKALTNECNTLNSQLSAITTRQNLKEVVEKRVEALKSQISSVEKLKSENSAKLDIARVQLCEKILILSAKMIMDDPSQIKKLLADIDQEFDTLHQNSYGQNQLDMENL